MDSFKLWIPSNSFNLWIRRFQNCIDSTNIRFDFAFFKGRQYLEKLTFLACLRKFDIFVSNRKIRFSFQLFFRFIFVSILCHVDVPTIPECHFFGNFKWSCSKKWYVTYRMFGPALLFKKINFQDHPEFNFQKNIQD